MLKSHALEIEREIEMAIDETLQTKADRSAYRSMVELCTEKLKMLRAYIAEREQALTNVLSAPPLAPA